MPDSPEALRILVCRHFLRETEAILASGDFPDLVAAAYSQDCGRPQDSDSLRAAFAKAEAGYQDEVILAGGCLSSSLGAELEGELEAKRGPAGRGRIRRAERCCDFLVDKGLVDEMARKGAYVLTPGWLSGWRARLAEWGFDRETARAFFAESAGRLLLLDTGLDEGSAGELAEFAEYVDRPAETIAVGLDHYRLELTAIAQGWRLEKKERELVEASRRDACRSADHAMLFDLVAHLTHMRTESETIDQILSLFDMLLAPKRLAYASIVGGRVESCQSRPPPAPSVAECQDWLDSGRETDRGTGEERSIFLRITYNEELLGLLEIEEVAFPEHREDYLHLAVPIAQVSGLAIANARMYQAVQLLATVDPLTGLLNRRRFFELGASEFTRARRYDHPLAALMLDIDYFKVVNDDHGHLAGDRVLIELSNCLRGELRATDACGRYGGEEFAFLMPESGMDLAMQAAERIRRKIEALAIAFDGKSLRVTASIGVAVADADCPDLGTLLGRSDIALYAAKKAGRNRTCAY